MIDTAAPSRRVIEIYEEGESKAIPFSDFLAYFPEQADRRSAGRLASLDCRNRCNAGFPSMVDWVDGMTYTHGCARWPEWMCPSLLEGNPWCTQKPGRAVWSANGQAQRAY